MIARRLEVTTAPRFAPRLRRLNRTQRGTILRVLALGIYTLVTVFPFYWMVITIFKQNSDLYNETNNPLWFNAAPTFANVQYLLEQTRFHHLDGELAHHRRVSWRSRCCWLFQPAMRWRD